MYYSGAMIMFLSRQNVLVAQCDSSTLLQTVVTGSPHTAFRVYSGLSMITGPLLLDMGFSEQRTSILLGKDTRKEELIHLYTALYLSKEMGLYHLD